MSVQVDGDKTEALAGDDNWDDSPGSSAPNSVDRGRPESPPRVEAQAGEWDSPESPAAQPVQQPVDDWDSPDSPAAVPTQQPSSSMQNQPPASNHQTDEINYYQAEATMSAPVVADSTGFGGVPEETADEVNFDEDDNVDDILDFNWD